MAYNEAMLIRRDLLTRVCKLIHSGTLRSEIDRVPLIMRPRYSKDVTRCCIYKDRAVIKYRLMAILGYDVRDERDELTPISEYARMAEERTEQTTTILTVVDLACSSCVQANYVVTNMCHGCVGHPCTFACHKNAISIHHQAYIDPSKCVSCGLCMKACPFNAIIYQAVPCEQSCPVNAISKDEHGIEHINDEKCIYCGRCREACPYGAIMEKTYLTQIYQALRSDKKVIALVAPSILGQFPAAPGKLFKAIKELGFDEVVEVAEGANMTAKHEAFEFEKRVVEEGQKFMTTSCCHAYTELVHKHLQYLESYVSHTPTPVVYTAGYAKKRKPSDKKPKITSRPFHYISSDGFHIYVGKNNYQNEELTFKLANGGDWWFHAKGIPGSHVILKTDGQTEIPDRAFEEAGALAAYYSKGRDNEKVEVDYIQKKNIRKVAKAAPGFVIYHSNYSLMAVPGCHLKQVE